MAWRGWLRYCGVEWGGASAMAWTGMPRVAWGGVGWRGIG